MQSQISKLLQCDVGAVGSSLSMLIEGTLTVSIAP